MSQHNPHKDTIAGIMRSENDFIKMKLMPEHEADTTNQISPQKQQRSKDYAFYKQLLTLDNTPVVNKTKTIFEKLGRPDDIKPLKDIEPENLATEISALLRRLNEKNIHLSTIRNNVPAEALYDFLSGEFLKVKITGHDSPGLHCFVYDEFHPDPLAENERIAIEYCIRLILQKKNLMHMFPAGRPIQLNGVKGLNDQALRKKIFEFKSAFTDIICISSEATKAVLKKDVCRITGSHTTGLCNDMLCSIIKGEWIVEFRLKKKNQWWIDNVRIDGINL